MGCGPISPSIKAGLNDTSKEERPSDRTTFSSPCCYVFFLTTRVVMFIAGQSTQSSMRTIFSSENIYLPLPNLCDLCQAITYATYSLRSLYLNLFFYLVTVVMYGHRLSSEGPYLLLYNTFNYKYSRGHKLRRSTMRRHA